MPYYKYKARDQAGKAAGGVITADGPDDLEAGLKDSGLYLITSRRVARPRAMSRRLPRKELIAFTAQLASIAGSGIPLLEGLEDISSESENLVFKATVDSIMSELRRGRSLSDALELSPTSFGPLYVNTVKAGEEMGSLEGVLERLVSYLEWEEEVSSKIKQAATYPAIVGIVLSVVITILVGFILPRFAAIFARKGFPLPLPTRILLETAGFMRGNWPVMIAAVIGLVLLAKTLTSTQAGRRAFDWTKLHLPVAGELMNKLALSRFAHTLATTVGSGVDIITAIDLAGLSTGNSIFAGAGRRAAEDIGAGNAVASSLKGTGLFPALFVRMVSVGETTGALATMLEKASQAYDREVRPAVARIMTAFEALVTIVMGIAVAMVALSIFLPLYKMLMLVRR
jgi:type II secretory pathway component PulF